VLLVCLLWLCHGFLPCVIFRRVVLLAARSRHAVACGVVFRVVTTRTDYQFRRVPPGVPDPLTHALSQRKNLEWSYFPPGLLEQCGDADEQQWQQYKQPNEPYDYVQFVLCSKIT